MTRTQPLLLLILALLGCGTEPASRDASPIEATEWVRPFDGYLPDCAPEDVAVLRVVDARTHKPIQGAIVRKHYEIEIGAGPKGRAPIAAEARTDAYGLVWFKPSAGSRSGQESHWSAHWSVQAPGYATTQEYGYAPQDTLELHRPRTRHGRVVDALGRPLVGMAIGYTEGGHSHFLTETTTDNDGRFVISGVSCYGDIFFAARGVLGDSFRGPLRRLGETPYTHVAKPAMRLRGRIAGAQPNELGARVVHALAYGQRGPFARIEDDGSFVIDGLKRERVLKLWSDASGETRKLSLDLVRPGGPFVWDLRLGPYDDPTDSATVAKRRLRVFVKDQDGQPAPTISVTAFRAADGRMQDWADDTPEEDDEEPVKPPCEVSLELLPGAYDLELCVDGGGWQAEPLRVEIGKEPPASVTIHAQALPRLELEWPGKDANVEAWMVTYAEPNGFINMEELRQNGDHLPPTVLARAAVPGKHRTWFFDVAPAVDGVRKVVVNLPALRRVTFTSAHTPIGVVLGGIDHEFTRADDGRFELETELEGSLELELACRDPRGETYLWSFRWITLGDQPVLDLGEIAWPERPLGRLTLLDAAGQPVADQQVEIDAMIDSRWVPGCWQYTELTTDDKGGVSSPLLRADAWLAVTTTEPKIFRDLAGPGPWTVRLGDATIELEVHGRYGILTDADIMIDGERFSRAGDHEDVRRPARYVVKTLAAGARILLVTAPGHRGEAHRVVLKPGEIRRIRVDLPERD